MNTREAFRLITEHLIRTHTFPEVIREVYDRFFDEKVERLFGMLLAHIESTGCDPVELVEKMPEQGADPFGRAMHQLVLLLLHTARHEPLEVRRVQLECAFEYAHRTRLISCTFQNGAIVQDAPN